MNGTEPPCRSGQTGDDGQILTIEEVARRLEVINRAYSDATRPWGSASEDKELRRLAHITAGQVHAYFDWPEMTMGEMADRLDVIFNFSRS